LPQYQFLEDSLRTGQQPELARQLVVPVLDPFAGTGLFWGEGKGRRTRVAGSMVVALGYELMCRVCAAEWPLTAMKLVSVVTRGCWLLCCMASSLCATPDSVLPVMMAFCWLVLLLLLP
jgi:hypothetical protein